MAAFLSNNWGTILIGVMIAGIVSAIIVKIIRDRRKGKCTGCDCGCGSGSCPSQSSRDT